MDLAKKRKADENGNSYTALGSVVPDPTGADANFSLLPSSPLTSEDINKILEPFTREQLLPIVHSALLREPGVLDAIRAVADAEPTRRKLFVRGLGWETNTDKLKAVFSAYGELEEGIVITDKNTGKSKGYGFVTFRHIDGAILALKEPNKKIDGRITVTQLASAGNSNSDVASRKIYVGNIPFEISSDRLLSHFSGYGEIEEGPLGFDMQTGKAKGFAFFVYKTEDGARASLADPVKTIDGHQVVCKLATDNKKLKMPGPNMGMGPGGLVGIPNTGPAGMPGDGSYGVQGGGYGYAAFPGGMAPGMQQQPQPPQQPGMAHAPHLGSGMGGPGGAGAYSNQGPGYGGYGQPGAPYGSTAGATGAGGLNNAAGGYRMPGSMTGSGGYEAPNYGMSSTYPSQVNQQATGPRPPTGGMYQGMGPYY